MNLNRIAFLHIMAMNIPLQSVFLYKGLWSPENDSILVATLIRLKQETMWTLDEFPIYFLLTARKEIKAKTGADFTEAEMKKRVEFLKDRYKTFKKVTADNGTHWEMPFKVVVASDEVWTKIMKVAIYQHILMLRFVHHINNSHLVFFFCLSRHSHWRQPTTITTSQSSMSSQLCSEWMM